MALKCLGALLLRVMMVGKQKDVYPPYLATWLGIFCLRVMVVGKQKDVYPPYLAENREIIFGHLLRMLSYNFMIV
ncbi:hypothetical protein BGP_5132 [Beggiatoa sp. PS]|nr:hypothetical protein BGP_5132 [Beggiatoa sp. PS]